MWEFLKKVINKGAKEGQTAVKAAPPAAPVPVEPKKAEVAHPKEEIRPAPAAAAPVAAAKPQKPHSEKTDDELAEELNKISPEILSQAKNPQMRKLIIDIYRKMLMDGVNINDDREVKKWLKKHPEVVNGGDVQKVETVKRVEPKVGRNDPCPCGSGKKYKKCHGTAEA